MNKKILLMIRKINTKCLNFSVSHKLKRVIGRPTGLMIEPFSGCNYKCPLCPAGLNVLKRDKKEMTFHEFKQYLGNFVYTLEYITLFHFGEPLLNKELPKMVRYCTKYYIGTQISTNGMLLTEEKAEKLFKAGLDRLIFSIDTYDGDIYPRYRVNGDFSKVVENIKMAVKVKNRLNANTVIVAQYMLMNENEDIEKMKEHGKRLGVDEVLIKTIGIGTSVKDHKKAYSFLPSNEKYSRYRANTVESKFNEYRCDYIRKRMVLCSDGTVLPCCRDQESEYLLGQCSDKVSLKDIWNNKASIDFRKATNENISDLSMCGRCPELLKYKLDPWVDPEERKNCEMFKL